jgi:hypothetical protein
MESYEFDVFVSYRGPDRSLADELVDDLEELELKVWFDKHQLQPGAAWIDQLCEGVKRSLATVVLVGEHNVTGWMVPEVRQALTEAVGRGAKFVPVILPGVEPPSELPGFMQQYQWIDCNEKAPFRGVLDQIVRAATGLRVAQALSAFGDEYALKVPRSDFGLRHGLRLFAVREPRGGRKVRLSWHAFGIGIDQLSDQIQEYGTALPVDACIGINDAGLIIATALNSSVLRRAPLGYVRTRKFGRQRRVSLEHVLLPELDPEPTVLIADFVVKSGSVLRAVSSRLEQEYEAPRIYFAAIGALTTGEVAKAGELGDLMAVEALQEPPVEDFFIAATMAAPGIALRFQLE